MESFFTILAIGIGFVLPYSSQTGIGYSLFEKIGILIYSLTIVTYAMTITATVFLQKKLRYEKTILPTFTSLLVFFVVFVGGILEKNIFIILAAFVFQTTVLSIHLFTLVKPHHRIDLQRFSFFSKNLLILSFPLAFILFLNLIYAKADTFLLSFMKPSFDVGVYGFAYRIFEFLIAVPTFFSNTVYPILLDSQHDIVVFTALVKKYTVFLFLLSLLLSIVGYFCVPILGALFPQLISVVDPLKVLILSLPFFFVTSLLQWVFIVRKKLFFLISMYAGTMILNIILNVLFIPQFSYHASALITVGTEGLVFLGMIGYLVLQAPNFSRKRK